MAEKPKNFEWKVEKWEETVWEHYGCQVTDNIVSSRRDTMQQFVAQDHWKPICMLYKIDLKLIACDQSQRGHDISKYCVAGCS